ncbi:hypothetical protein M413DRAFT_9330 [Hebeloma cylindrosporum]|uniref:Uncharacterized protein n=1 Tax=Hebeloma cylindrosporum TaxID=76867 RepID=A0A0C3C5J4_HEBCY|nr:hypothetical protein M413DRAFT_9330 [Hebeloma cylindrosporum h7]
MWNQVSVLEGAMWVQLAELSAFAIYEGLREEWAKRPRRKRRAIPTSNHKIPMFLYGETLYSVGPNPPAQFARISLSSDNARVLLKIMSEAFRAGLFEPSFISTVLLCSARNIN